VLLRSLPRGGKAVRSVSKDHARRERPRSTRAGLREVLAENGSLANRLRGLREFGSQVRTSEYHITNACNLRCEGCWFFAYDYDARTRDEGSLDAWLEFAREQAGHGITSALLIGGEPTLFPERVRPFVDHMKFVTISTNGLARLPMSGFERVTVAITLFGGGPIDDQLRAIKPSGRRFSGLLDTVLNNYRDDSRAIFIFALTPGAVEHIEPTVRRIAENGNIVTFNYYSSYGSGDPPGTGAEDQLLNEALRVKRLFPETVVCDSYYIETLITGTTHFGRFSYNVCPSISTDHPDNKARLHNGHPVLPRFNSYAADAKSVNFCCTSGHCEGCRDSQAIYSWLMVSLSHFLDSRESLERWIRVAESYWSQFIWSPYHRTSIHQREPC
jgi:MoaA/NifB/PqqE/SkfB family radical SAM enzyme